MGKWNWFVHEGPFLSVTGSPNVYIAWKKGESALRLASLLPRQDELEQRLPAGRGLSAKAMYSRKSGKRAIDLKKRLESGCSKVDIFSLSPSQYVCAKPHLMFGLRENTSIILTCVSPLSAREPRAERHIF